MIYLPNEFIYPLIGHQLFKGCVGFWPMKRGSGNKVFDLSGNGNIFTFGAGAASPTWVFDKFGSCLSFDGGDYAESNNEANFDFSTSFSIIMWFKRGDNSQPVRLINKPGDALFYKNSFAILFTDDAPVNRIQAYFRNTLNASQSVYSTAAMTDTASWHQVAAVWSSSESKWYLYLDGVLDNTASTTGTILLNDKNVFIGAADATNEHYTGLINAPLIYNRFLTASEIALLCSNPLIGFDYDPIELWAAATQGGGAPPSNAMPMAMDYYRRLRVA